MPAQTTIVLVHGWAGSAESWEPVEQRLAAHRNFVVHGVRLPGSPRGSDAPPTISSAVKELVALLRAMDAPAVLVGHSLGAQVTLRAHAEVPNQVLTEVVIDPAYGAAAEERDAMAQWAAQIEVLGHPAIAAFFTTAGSGLSTSDLARLQEDLHSTSPQTIASYLRSEYVDPDSVGLLPASASIAAQRRKPVLALHSSLDGVSRERKLPSPIGSRIEHWRGFGHYMHLQDPERFTDLIADWISTHDNAPRALAATSG